MDRIGNDSRRILIAGYPRSGTTFLHFASKKLYGLKTNYSTQTHSLRDLQIRSQDFVCIAIRHPLEAISSWNDYRHQFGVSNPANREIELDGDFNYYLRFYSELKKENVLSFETFTNKENAIKDFFLNRYDLQTKQELNLKTISEEMRLKGGRNHLPRDKKINREKLRNLVRENSLYEKTVSLYRYLTDTE